VEPADSLAFRKSADEPPAIRKAPAECPSVVTARAVRAATKAEMVEADEIEVPAALDAELEAVQPAQHVLVVESEPEPESNETSPAPNPPVYEPRAVTPQTLLQHAADYGWLQGVLEYVHADSGRWKLRYAPLDADDRFGGSVLLTPDVCTNQFNEGDFVYVEGEIVQSPASTTRPFYRVHTIRAVHTAR
jgi:hypothetical protein